MENRDRDKVSQGTRPTEAGDINRDVESRRGIEKNSDSDSDSSAEFGQKIGESERSSSMGDERSSRRGETEH